MLYNDDTTIRILELMGKRAKQKALAEDSVEGVAKEKASQRSGLFTSGIVSTGEGQRIALFFSGRKHAGENLKDVLIQRAADLAPPIQMCDAHLGHVQFAGASLGPVASAETPILSTKLVVSRTVMPNHRL